jgi:hypothetical protein
VVSIAPRISPRLLLELERLDDPNVPLAEIWRRVGAAADRLGLARPSYERIRLLVQQSRLTRTEPSTSEVVADVLMRSRPPEALLDHISGVGVPRRAT